jgi:ribonuclease HI
MSSIPPWDVIRPHCDTRLFVLPKACTSPDTYRRLFSEMLSQYPEYTVMFTDGSLMNGSTGCAFILNAQASKFRPNRFSSISSAELFALWKALEAVGYQPPGQFLLCTDSLSTIQGLQSPSLTHPFIQELCLSCHSLFKRGFDIAVSWIPGHVGISGNEAADAAARDATFQGTLIPGVTSMD